MFCHKCGSKMSEGAGFCHKCGAKIATDDTAMPIQDKSVAHTATSNTTSPIPKQNNDDPCDEQLYVSADMKRRGGIYR